MYQCDNLRMVFGFLRRIFWIVAVGSTSALSGYGPIAAPRACADEIEQANTELPVEARAALERYEEEAAAIRQRATAEVNARRDALIERLQALQDEYTRAANLDAAVAVRDELRRLITERTASSCLHGDVQLTAVRRIVEDPGTMTEYSAQVGETLLVSVVGRNDGTVWGVDEYTYDSDVSAAAMHAGLLREGERRVLRVTMSKGPTQFRGAIRNGVSSSSWDNSGGHYSAFRLQPADVVASPAESPVAPLNISELRGRTNTVVHAVLVGSASGSVWGTDVYTDDSDPATAAVHAGVLGVGQRGIVKITILSGRDGYTGSTRNGVTTGDWESFGGSFRVDPAERDTERR